ncbi:MAG: TIM barrel protein [Armatimonadetes bacterium]|nr:TIM barrel protein [Armatimonadota bacterium]
MKTSVAGFSVHGLIAENRINVFGYLESCRYRYALRTADLWSGQIGTRDETVLRKVRDALDERELTLVNYHVDGVHLWEDDSDRRERNRQGALAELRAAVLLGAKTVRFDTGGKIAPMTTEQHDYLVTCYGEYCRFAHDHGFRVGAENHWGLSLVADNMETIARDVAHRAYGVLLHLGHWEDGDPEGGDKRLAPYAMHTHVDAATTYGGNLASKIQMLWEADYSGYWGIEHHSGKNEYVEIAAQLAQVQRTLAFLQSKQAENETPTEAKKTLNPLLTPEQESQA